MTHLEEELTKIRVCGALRDLPICELQDSVSLARVIRSAVQREIIRRKVVVTKEKAK